MLEFLSHGIYSRNANESIIHKTKRGCKKTSQEKRLPSCKKSKTAVFFCGIIKVS